MNPIKFTLYLKIQTLHNLSWKLTGFNLVVALYKSIAAAVLTRFCGSNNCVVLYRVYWPFLFIIFYMYVLYVHVLYTLVRFGCVMWVMWLGLVVSCGSLDSHGKLLHYHCTFLLPFPNFHYVLTYCIFFFPFFLNFSFFTS